MREREREEEGKSKSIHSSHLHIYRPSSHTVSHIHIFFTVIHIYQQQMMSQVVVDTTNTMMKYCCDHVTVTLNRPTRLVDLPKSVIV